MNYLRILIILCAFPVLSIAQIRFTTKVPQTVFVEEPFQVSYEVNSADVSSFSQPTFNGLDCLNGPAVSVFSMSGSHGSQQSTTYTYMLMATKAGSYNIPAATVFINGKAYRSKALTVKVKEDSGNSNQNSSQSQSAGKNNNNDLAVQPAGSSITNRDLFLTVTTNKRKVYEQEPVVLTYKVHSRVGVGLRNVMPKKKTELDGFLTQEVELPANISPTTATHNGVLYKEGIYRQYVIFPQTTGTLTIPSLAFDCEVLQQNVSIDAVDAFFNGAGMLSVRVERTSPEMKLEVLPLPSPRPNNFSGGVGKFSISSELLTSQPLTHEPCTYRLTLTGVGNLKLISNPKIIFPEDFEAFEPKITDETQLTAEGIAGKIVYDYTFVPNNEGKYVIPATEFVYFDNVENKYKTIKSQPIELTVKKGKHSAEDWEKERRFRESDIAAIKTTKGNWWKNGLPNFWGNAIYWSVYLLLIILCVIIKYLLSKHIKRKADTVGRKSKHAGKLALKKLSETKTLISHSENNTFYISVADAINEYLRNKYSLSSSELSREKIMSVLKEDKCNEKVIQSLKEVMDTCEYAQFAPNSDIERQHLLQKAVEIINQLENKVSTSKRFFSFCLIAFFFLFSLNMMANQKSLGDSAYNKKNYVEAVSHYESALKQDSNSTIYYNLGCAYYRLEQLPQAILNFERALRLNPADENTRFNLEICRHRIVDRFNRADEMFFATYLKELIATRSAGQWGFLALWLFVCTLVLFEVYWLGRKVWLRKLTFFTALIAFLFCISFNIFAGIQHHTAQSQTKAVVFTKDNVYSSSTDGAKALREINPGTTLIITDIKVNGWYGITLPDGTEGWVRRRSVKTV